MADIERKPSIGEQKPMSPAEAEACLWDAARAYFDGKLTIEEYSAEKKKYPLSLVSRAIIGSSSV